MKAEIIAVGTELLLGQIVNGNAAEISEMLAQSGVDVLFHSVVGDNEQRIASVIETAMTRADAVIITGGLGPTHDDLTREALSAVTSQPLEVRADLEKALRERFEAMGRQMAPENLKQATAPAGSHSISNPNGTAPGIRVEHRGKVIYAVPGVPFEMRSMMQSEILPDLVARSGSAAVLVSRVLKATGMGESDVANRIGDLIVELDRAGSCTIALLASMGEVKIRISAKAPDRASAERLIQPVEEKVRDRLGSAIFGVDSDTLEVAIARLLRGKGLTLAVAESVTGGLVVSRLINVPGASEFLNAGFVTYATESKISDLGVDAGLIERHGVVSPETVMAMAQQARLRGAADLGLSTTGEAGPDPQEASVGKIFLGMAHAGGTLHRSLVAPGPRMVIRNWATQAALNFLRLWLLEEIS